MFNRLLELIKQADDICSRTKQCEECVGMGKGQECINHLIADHLLANGVIVPPCKAGDTVWLVFTPKYPANPADKGKWFMSQDGVQRIIYGVKGLSIETWNVGTISAKEIGKKLFLTREEAEAALSVRKEYEGK